MSPHACVICGRPRQRSAVGACRHCPKDDSAQTEAETVTRIVAWLRAEADARASRGCMAGADDLAGFADAIERGDWKADGGRDG